MEDLFYKELGYFIRTQRRRKELSQEFMATKLSISQSAYHKIEAGKTRCSVFLLLGIFSLLGVNSVDAEDFSFWRWSGNYSWGNTKYSQEL